MKEDYESFKDLDVEDEQPRLPFCRICGSKFIIRSLGADGHVEECPNCTY